VTIRQTPMLEWLETCESTSKLLKERTKDGFSRPTAVAAAMQTAGVGRLGRSWISQRDNLHLSIALPPGYLDANFLQVLPMVSGALAAEWIESKLGLSICIKWPNDLFLDGKKIGGILCEATYEGAEFRGAIIGIGINLVSSPKISESDAWDYWPGCLPSGSITPRPTREMAMELTESLLSGLKTLDMQDILGRWQRFAIKSGHEWINSKGPKTDASKAQAGFQRLLDRGIDKIGQLQLEPVVGSSGNSGIILVNSVANEHTWSLAKNGQAIVADVGNTVTKLAVVTNKEKIQVATVAAGDEAIERLLKSFTGAEKPSVIHTISVNPEGFEHFKRMVSAHGIHVREVQRQPVGLLNSHYDLNAIGMDRFASLEAFLYLNRLNITKTPAMVVSLGTATTVDIIDTKGCHLGGYIVAGLQTSLDAVSMRGRNLPKNLEVSDAFKASSQGKWPTSSRDAMTHGTAQMMLSFLQQERVKLAKQSGLDLGTVHVYLTGGFSEPVKHMWPDTNVHSDPQLTLLGTAVLAFNGR
jgi:biotin-[acetyl-CoA-carboxylase] ligase BirA-like protein